MRGEGAIDSTGEAGAGAGAGAERDSDVGASEGPLEALTAAGRTGLTGGTAFGGKGGGAEAGGSGGGRSLSEFMGRMLASRTTRQNLQDIA